MDLTAITDRRNRSIDQFADHKVSGQKSTIDAFFSIAWEVIPLIAN